MEDIEPERNILLSIDNSDNSTRAVQYLGKIVGQSRLYRVTVLNIVEDMGVDFFPSADEKEKHLAAQNQAADRLLTEAHNLLISCGIPEECIGTEKTVAKNGYIAETIIQRARQNKNGTLVVGRRGISKKEEFLFGSVSSKIVSYAKNCTVWVVE